MENQNNEQKNNEQNIDAHQQIEQNGSTQYASPSCPAPVYATKKLQEIQQNRRVPYLARGRA